MIRTFLGKAAFQVKMAACVVSDILRSQPAPRRNSTRRSRYSSLGVQRLEERCLMSATPWEPDIDRLLAYEFPEYPAVAEVRAGATDVTVANTFVMNRFGTTDIRGLTVTGTGTTSLQNVASRVTVWADLDGDANATMETLIGAAVVRSNKVDIVLNQRLDARFDTLAMQLRIDTKAGANTASIGLDVTAIKATDERGRMVANKDIGLLDTNDSQVRVMQQDNVLFLQLSTPSSGALSRGEQNAVLATIRVGTTEGDALIKRLAIAVEARDSFDRLTANVGRELTGIELRNTVTGQVIGGTLKAQGTGYQVLTFSNFIARNGDEWQIRADIGSNAAVQDGDHYRVLVNGAETGSTTFGGLTKPLSGIDLEARDADSGRGIVRTFPGGTLASNFQRIGQTTLNVAVQSIAPFDTAVANAKNQLGVRFIAQSGDIDASRITDVAVNAATGDIRNAWRFALWVDTDGDSKVDTVLQAGVSSGADGVVRFNDLVGGGYVVPAGTVTAFEVRFDVQSSLLPDRTMRLILNDIKAEEVRTGAPVNSLSVSQGSNSTLWTFEKQGDLFVTKSLMPVPSRQLLGGALSDPVLVIEVTGRNEPIDVTKLAFQSLGGYANSVDRLELHKAGAATPFAIATLAGTGVDPIPAGSSVFTANMQSRQLVVPEGETLTILVRARIKSDAQGGISGEQVQFQLLRVEARGSDSSNNLLPNDGDALREGEVFIGTNAPGLNTPVVSPKHIVVMSKITSVVNADPNADGTAVPIGTAPIGQFKFTAASNTNVLNGLNGVGIQALMFTMNVSNVSFDANAMFIYNKADSSSKMAGVVYDSAFRQVQGNVVGNGTYYIVFDTLRASTVNTLVQSGTSQTLVVQGKINGSGSGSSLQLSLESFSNPVVDNFNWDLGHIAMFDEDASNGYIRFFGFDYPETVVRSTKYRS